MDCGKWNQYKKEGLYVVLQLGVKSFYRRVLAVGLIVVLVFLLFIPEGYSGVYQVQAADMWNSTRQTDASITQSGITSEAPQLQVDESGVSWYLIENAEELYWFADAVNQYDTQDSKGYVPLHAKLTKDITIQSLQLQNGVPTGDVNTMTEWRPIGDSTHKYAGIFDGQGHTISGLYLNVEDKSTKAENHGLFGEIGVGTWDSRTHQGTIRNVTLENSYLSSTATNLGGIAGVSRGGIIQNCGFFGTLKGNGSVTGGLVGTNANQSVIRGEVMDCWCDVQLQSVMGAGGLVGQNNGILKHCQVSGSVRGASSTSVHSYSGGLVGTCGGTRNNSYGLVINCFSKAQVSSSENGAYIGALAGKATGGYFINCYGSGYDKRGFGEVPTNSVSEETGMKVNNYYYEATEGEKVVGDYYPIAYNCYYLGDADFPEQTVGNYNEIPCYTRDTFASGQVAYWLNHGSATEIYRAFGLTVSPAYGQRLPEDELPVFLDEDGLNTVHCVTYQGDYEGKVYCNQVTTLPVCQESGYTYEFIYADTSLAGQQFTGKDITGDVTVTVNLISIVPGTNAEGVFEIKNAMHLKWFADYVNGLETLPGQDRNATCADAVLLSDIDMTGQDWTPIGSMNTGETEETARYQTAYKGTFDGQYHVITGLHATTIKQIPMGLFGCTYGAQILRLGVEDLDLSGREKVGGICGVAIGTKIINCYVTGTMNMNMFSGGIVGYAGIITVGSANQYDSATLATEIYRCYASCRMDAGGGYDMFVGGICGKVAAAQNIGGKQEKVSLANCYYDKDKAEGVGAFWQEIGGSQYSLVKKVENSVLGFSTKDFLGGKVTWLLQQASAQQGDRYLTASTYQATKSLTGSDGIQEVTLRSQDLIWCQQISIDSSSSGNGQAVPQFADSKSTEQKQKMQVYRYAAINVNTVYEKDGVLAEKYGNTGFSAKTPEGYPSYPQDAPDPEKPHYFVGWTGTPKTELGNTLIQGSFVVKEDTYIYAYYDAEGIIDIQCSDKDISYEYGREYHGESVTLSASCSMSDEAGYLSYQWYELVRDKGNTYVENVGGNYELVDGKVTELLGETGNFYAIPVDLAAGTHLMFCRVTAKNGVIKDSDIITITITKKPLSEDLFTRIADQYYTNKEVTPGVLASSSEEKLMKESDYEVTYENNKNLTNKQSMARAVVKASAGGNYSGSVTLPFSIIYLPQTENMYTFLGEQTEEYYLDTVQIVPSGGYLMASRLNGNYTEQGITFHAIHEFDTYTLSFYIKDSRTGAMTDVISRQVRVKKKQVSTEESGSSEENNTEENPAVYPASPSMSTEAPGEMPYTQTPIKDSHGEVISYFDGWEKPQTGQYYTIGNYRYKVTKSTVAGGTVELNRVVNRKLTRSNIPVYVTINGFHYLVNRVGTKAFHKLPKLKRVTGGDNIKTIGSYAFAKCPKLTTVTLGNKVTSVGSYAFYKDKRLKKIIVPTKKLKKVGKNALKKTANKIMIKVPAKCKGRYRKLFAKKGQKRGKIV